MNRPPGKRTHYRRKTEPEHQARQEEDVNDRFFGEITIPSWPDDQLPADTPRNLQFGLKLVW